MNDIELHGERTGNSFRVAVALEEVGLPYSVTKVDLSRAEHKGERYMAINPAGKVPAIIDRTVPGDPFVLTQSNAIIMYLDLKVPGVLFPVEGRKRAIALERLFYFVTDVIGPGMASFKTRGNDVAHRTLLSSALNAWTAADRFLENSEFMAGDEFSAADIAAATFILAYHRHLDWSEHPALENWFERMRARPSFQNGIAAFN